MIYCVRDEENILAVGVPVSSSQVWTARCVPVRASLLRFGDADTQVLRAVGDRRAPEVVCDRRPAQGLAYLLIIPVTSS